MNLRCCFAAAILMLGPAFAPAQPQAVMPESAEPPQERFEDLFETVQMQRLYTDEKVFADAIPLSAPADILRQYHALRPSSSAALKSFVDAHFTLPAEVHPVTAQRGAVSLLGHIDALWNPLTRSTPTAASFSSLLSVPRPYVVPGGRFREVYYWDSYFTMLGLALSGRSDLVEDMVADFAYLIDTYGHVPNGTRTYYLSRSQPPFFFAMVGLLTSDDVAASYARYLPQLEREYAFWMRGAAGLRAGQARWRVVALPDGSILNRYWDDRDTPRDESYWQDRELARTSGRPAQALYRDIRAAAESGWDFSSRWFADGRSRATIDTTEIVPIDLNSLLFGLENAIRQGCERRGDRVCERDFRGRAATRRGAMDHYLWNSAVGAYFDYRWSRQAQIERLSAATLYPLFTGLASDRQAVATAKETGRQLLQPGGIVTTPVTTGEQWDAPNGWAPIQWIAIAGLRRYGQTAFAATIACRWMLDVNSVYQDQAKLVEKYDVVHSARQGGGGEYPSQDGFGWTNGVMRELIALYPAYSVITRADQCPP